MQILYSRTHARRHARRRSRATKIETQKHISLLMAGFFDPIMVGFMNVWTYTESAWDAGCKGLAQLGVTSNYKGHKCFQMKSAHN